MTKPLCLDKDHCGSCGWSHIPYEKQLQQKLSDINGSFKLKNLDERVLEIAPSPKTEHYRNRMDFVIDFEGRVGMREKGKWWRVIDNHTCFLGMERIEELFKIVREWTKNVGLSFYDRKANTGLLRYAVIRAATTGEAMVIVVTSKPSDTLEAKRVREELTNLSSLIPLRPVGRGTSPMAGEEAQNTTSLIWSINPTISDVSFGTELETISGSGFIEEIIGGLRYRITPNAFFQTNPYAAPILLDTVREFAQNLAGKTVLDLYCGSGFFGIGLESPNYQTKDKQTTSATEHDCRQILRACGSKFRRQSSTATKDSSALLGMTRPRIIGVELVPDAIRDARVNAELNNVNIEFHEAKTEDFDWSQYQADIVILDPPRSGMHDKALADVLRIKPETIIYVSCNYKNFARELVLLKEWYDVSAMRAVDMFPHTPHVELVSKLVRCS